ncbi:ABC transporter ATP-binding protein [Aquibacillus kalidii]|uniref:ABC transporter ATP-binding protein n=1 Tax=Aquibacillus kalidii TaxID=2762597 RepID=UPI001F37521B|nr:ABC transporter ATP-binding protein [Aquibacillus kalidii]
MVSKENSNRVQQTTSRHNQGLKMKKPKIKNITATIKRLWSYMSYNKPLFALVIVLVVISSVLSLLGPYLLGKAVDAVIDGSQTSVLFKFMIILFLVFVGQSIALWFQNSWMITIAQQTVYRIRKDLFKRVLHLPIQYYQTVQSGELMSRLTNDVENVSRTLNSTVIQLTTSVLTLVGTVVFMLWLSPLLTLFTLIIVPIMFVGMNWITKRTSSYFKEQQVQLGDMNGYVEETLSGHTMIKLFNQEKRVIEKYKQKNRALKDASYWAQVYSGFIPKLMNTLNNFSFAIIVGIGGFFAINGDVVTIGVIVTFTTYSRQFTRPLNDLANQYNVILSAVAGAERVFEVMDEPEEKQNEYKANDINQIKGDVDFDSVHFSYNEGMDTVKNVSFSVSAGETIALVGPTGAGKTTIISLLSKFYEVEKGAIFIDGQNLNNITRFSLRAQMGMVLQDSYLFDTTIIENIRYGRLQATDEQVIEAAKAANADSFIRQLPEGYYTVLDSNGSGISQGQRQLISIARAMLADPSILILDEATSSIDTITEMKISQALNTLMKGRTCFIIAHRLNTIQHADKIIVLNDGQVIEQGTHQTLLHQDGFYANLFSTQNRAGNSGD